MQDLALPDRGGLSHADVEMRPYELLSVVYACGGNACPLVSPERAQTLRQAVRAPACRIRLVTDADEVPFYQGRDFAAVAPETVLSRKRDLDVLQRLGLTPGATVRSRFAFERLFAEIQTLRGVCAYDTAGWEGCALAANGTYERVRAQGAGAVVAISDKAECARRKAQAAMEIREATRLFIQPHILMCIGCDYAGGGGGRLRASDEIWELRKRMEADPDVEITLVEDGLCMVCGSCDGFDRQTQRCVHQGGLIRNFKKNLDAFQLLGLMPGATMKARDLLPLIWEKIPSTRLVCGYRDGIITAAAWSICGSPEGNPGYAKTRERPFLKA